MEDVLDVYARPYDARHPVVCLDETSKTLLSARRERIPAAPGQAAREDYTFECNGAVSLFMLTEPLGNWRRVSVSAQRTKLDFAREIEQLVTQDYPDAESIVLICDNLNTHVRWALYEAFEAGYAKQLLDKLEWHYTPEHGSWLNMAEIELSVLSQQCLARRIGDKEELEQEVAAWAAARNRAGGTVDWQFTTADARIKLKRLYPVVKT